MPVEQKFSKLKKLECLSFETETREEYKNNAKVFRMNVIHVIIKNDGLFNVLLN